MQAHIRQHGLLSLFTSVFWLVPAATRTAVAASSPVGVLTASVSPTTPGVSGSHLVGGGAVSWPLAAVRADKSSPVVLLLLTCNNNIGSILFVTGQFDRVGDAGNQPGEADGCQVDIVWTVQVSYCVWYLCFVAIGQSSWTEVGNQVLDPVVV